MTAELLGEVLIYLGGIGVLQFAALAFSARQLQATTTTGLHRRPPGAVARRAHPLAVASSGLLLVGVLLRVFGIA